MDERRVCGLRDYVHTESRRNSVYRRGYNARRKIAGESLLINQQVEREKILYAVIGRGLP